MYASYIQYSSFWEQIFRKLMNKPSFNEGEKKEIYHSTIKEKIYHKG